MRLGKGKRRALAALGFLLAALLLIVLAVPLWLPWTFESAASRAGLRYSTYERKGYAHFILRGVTFTNADVRFRAAQAELLTPTIWAWHCVAGAGINPPPFVRAEDWSLRILERSPAQQAAPSASIYTNATDVTNAIVALKRWLPAAELSNGTLQFPTTEILLPHVKWSQGDLNASWEMPGQHQHGAIHANFQMFPCRAQIQSDSAQLQADLSLSFDSAGLSLQAAGSWQTNRFQSDVHFSRTSTLPDAGSIKGPGFPHSRNADPPPRLSRHQWQPQGRLDEWRIRARPNGRRKPVNQHEPATLPHRSKSRRQHQFCHNPNRHRLFAMASRRTFSRSRRSFQGAPVAGTGHCEVERAFRQPAMDQSPRNFRGRTRPQNPATKNTRPPHFT
jgi:hypothetical protein